MLKIWGSGLQAQATSGNKNPSSISCEQSYKQLGNNVVSNSFLPQVVEDGLLQDIPIAVLAKECIKRKMLLESYYWCSGWMKMLVKLLGRTTRIFRPSFQTLSCEPCGQFFKWEYCYEL